MGLLRKLRPRITYANVVATLALFLTLGGGTAFAIVAANQVNSESIIDGEVKNRDLAPNSVGSGKIVDRSVLGFDVADDSLTTRQIIEGQLTKVPRAAVADEAGTVFAANVDAFLPLSGPGERALLRLNLPAGAYLIFGKLVVREVKRSGDFDPWLVCTTRAGSDSDSAVAGHMNLGQEEDATMLVAHESKDPFTASLNCNRGNEGDRWKRHTVRLIAYRVDHVVRP